MNSSSAAASTPSIVGAPDSGAATVSVDSTEINGVNGQFLTGEEIQPLPQPQPQPQSEVMPSSQPQSVTQTPNLISSVPAPVPNTTSDFGNVPPLNPSTSAKLPFRPSKIRKISPDNPHVEVEPGCASNSIAAAPASATAEVTKPSVASTSKAGKNKMTVAQSRAQPALRLVARPLSYQGEIDRALLHLRGADPHLAQLIDLHQPPTFDTFQPPFLALTKSILYQQLAYKAGTSIYARFVALCGGEEGVLPETVLSLNPQQLRQIGISARKAGYLNDLARKYQTGILSDESIINMDDKSLFTMLTMVNGIGCWSVHMFMIFSLHRPDVLPVNDLGVRKGVQLLYGLEDLPRPSQMDKLCEKWRPYRSVASWYLWRFVEAKGTPSSAAAVSAAGISLTLEEQVQQHPQQLQQLPLQQQHQQQTPEQQQQHQQQQQFIDPINGIMNLGYSFL